MSDTPETDAAYKNHPWDMHDHIPLEFCQKLERERNELIKAAEAVIERWESPKWKEAVPTAYVLNALYNVVAKVKGGEK